MAILPAGRRDQDDVTCDGAMELARDRATPTQNGEGEGTRTLDF